MERKPGVPKRAVFVALGASFTLLAACGGHTDQLRSDVASLEHRIGEIERSSGRYQTQLHQVEEDVLLLEDRVEAHRLSLERRGTVQARNHSELPAYRPPTVAPDHSYMADLPVERLAPPAPAPEREVDDLQELVITNETIAQFVEQHGGVEPASNNSGERARPPVVVGDRLPSANSAPPVRAASSDVARPARTGPPLDDYQAALALFNEGDYQGALAAFSAFFSAGPALDYQDNALFWIGECHYAIGDYSAALLTFEQVIRDYPDGNKVPDSLLKIGLTYEQLDARDQAHEVLGSLVETYPLTDAARRASERLAELN